MGGDYYFLSRSSPLAAAVGIYWQSARHCRLADQHQADSLPSRRASPPFGAVEGGLSSSHWKACPTPEDNRNSQGAESSAPSGGQGALFAIRGRLGAVEMRVNSSIEFLVLT